MRASHAASERGPIKTADVALGFMAAVIASVACSFFVYSTIRGRTGQESPAVSFMLGHGL
jgi:hypothetical protein